MYLIANSEPNILFITKNFNHGFKTCNVRNKLNMLIFNEAQLNELNLGT